MAGWLVSWPCHGEFQKFPRRRPGVRDCGGWCGQGGKGRNKSVSAWLIEINSQREILSLKFSGRYPLPNYRHKLNIKAEEEEEM